MKIEIMNRVKIKCPVYRNDKTFYGVLKERKTVNGREKCWVVVDGNKRAIVFASIWISPVDC